MTTGCCCSTAGCPGLSQEPGGQCTRCQIAATPSTAARLAKQIVYTVLEGRETPPGHPAACWQENKEAAE